MNFDHGEQKTANELSLHDLDPTTPFVSVCDGSYWILSTFVACVLLCWFAIVSKSFVIQPEPVEPESVTASARGKLSPNLLKGTSLSRSSKPHARVRKQDPCDIEGILSELYQKNLQQTEGRISKEIYRDKALSGNAFSICAVTVKGDMIQLGDSRQEFPLVSIAKPLVFGQALEDHGSDYVRKKVGVEPTGSTFNSLIRHDEISRGNYNPMVNLGAIATTSLVKGRDLAVRKQRLLEMLRHYTGREMEIDSRMFDHRRRNDSLNRAMAYFMQSEGLLTAPVEETLELYATQCSVGVCCEDLAMIAATLANSGINPRTEARALAPDFVKDLLSVMFSSGLYEFSGQWAYKVGLPAKSGLAGSILAVVPGRMGVAIYSPPLDSNHKSTRGVGVLTDLSERLNTHVFCGSTRPPISSRRSTSMRRKQGLVALLAELHAKYAPLREGKPYVCDSEVTQVDPNKFGICAVSVDGRVQAVGDWQHPFLLQSLSKVFVYGMALEDHGRDYIRRRVDVEPTGAPFDAIIKLEQKTKRPFNPMVNTGGIATTSLIKGKGRAQRLQRVLQMYSRYVGKEVRLDAPAFLAEQTSGDRNRAISYLLRHFGMVNGSIDETLDLYLQQCSITVTARDLAIMAATLAGRGVNPMTGERAIESEYVKDLLSIMYTCGMYDFSGGWAYKIGLPAKSGVGGGIMAVVPGEMGIAVFSPPLDDRGNSVRGIRVFEELSNRLGLHVFEPERS